MHNIEIDSTDNISEKYNLLQTIQEDVHNLNRSIVSKKTMSQQFNIIHRDKHTDRHIHKYTQKQMQPQMIPW